MDKVELGKKRRIRRKRTIRGKIFGTSIIPRLSVFRSNKYIYVQAIDDEKGMTIESSSSFQLGKGKMKLNKKTASEIGKDIALKLKNKKIETVVFDRNGFLYTGKIKSLADAARENGIKF